MTSQMGLCTMSCRIRTPTATVVFRWSWTWLMACGRADLLPKIKNLGSYRLCSLHFENKMFTNIVYKNRLLPTATPTKFPSMESSSSTTSNDHAYCLNPQKVVVTEHVPTKKCAFILIINIRLKNLFLRRLLGTNDRFLHESNLCVAVNVCSVCIKCTDDLDEPCPTCGERVHIFREEDPVQSRWRSK
ncbi:hypothetical protein RI129_003029 [Pyrocoelia pectoralis]|uniref:THAP-type domain-containing protein n=1 Tax=Pyrocoelia pectoralis TaxID=417401 RepID=A0AAN7ZMB3_9COLE